jgi:hypothetical protein
MSSPVSESRPVKKRRFFVEDPSDEDHEYLTSEDTHSPQPIKQSATENGAAETTSSNPESTAIANSELLGFDVNLLNAVAGEELPSSTVLKLRELSNGNIERGRSSSRVLGITSILTE